MLNLRFAQLGSFLLGHFAAKRAQIDTHSQSA
jgi:hypothetical protein